MDNQGQNASGSAGSNKDNFNEENLNAEHVMREAEQKFRDGMRLVNDWGAQAREIIQRQPAAVLAGVAVLGFVTGLLLRRLGRGDER